MFISSILYFLLDLFHLLEYILEKLEKVRVFFLYNLSFKEMLQIDVLKEAI